MTSFKPDRILKVAVYCRVSTDSSDQVNSLASQQSYFKEYIERNPMWELYDIYVDEGITGTSTKKRKAFNRMMVDAQLKKYDLIITKEISRPRMDFLTCFIMVYWRSHSYRHWNHR